MIKKKKSNPELRMYFLVMYNISPIQQGIQALHALVEYFLKHWKDKEFWRWAKTHKTVIILNGGTSNDGTQTEYGYPIHKGSMEQHFTTLKDNKIKCACFREPDLNYATSAVAFLVDERVFNKKDYPDYIPTTIQEFGEDVYSADHKQFDEAYKTFLVREKKGYDEEVGKDVAFLKDFLKQFRLA